jgi:hypothetical protein
MTKEGAPPHGQGLGPPSALGGEAAPRLGFLHSGYTPEGMNGSILHYLNDPLLVKHHVFQVNIF